MYRSEYNFVLPIDGEKVVVHAFLQEMEAHD